MPTTLTAAVEVRSVHAVLVGTALADFRGRRPVAPIEARSAIAAITSDGPVCLPAVIKLLRRLERVLLLWIADADDLGGDLRSPAPANGPIGYLAGRGFLARSIGSHVPDRALVLRNLGRARLYDMGCVVVARGDILRGRGADR